MILAASLFLIQSAFGALPEAAQAELTRCGIDEEALDQQLALDYHGFDQNFEGGGWRGLARKDGCEVAQAELIKAYILYSTPKPTSSMNTLRWHAGQALAAAGRAGEALPYFRGAYHHDASKGEEKEEWDVYVDATIAFLERDRDALHAARDSLAAFSVSEEEKEARRQFLKDNPRISMPPGFVDEPSNLNVVEGFIACFDEPYKDAYGRACQNRAHQR